jgi:hypothetical protein
MISDGMPEDISTREDLVVHVPLFLSLIDILSGAAQYQSRFDMARALLRLIREPSFTDFMMHVGFYSFHAIERFSQVLGPPPSDSRLQPNATLPDTLPPSQADVLFDFFEHMLDRIRFTGMNAIGLVARQVAVVRILEWMLRERPDVFKFLTDNARAIAQSPHLTYRDLVYRFVAFSQRYC